MREFTRRHPGRTVLRHDARTRPLKPARWEDAGDTSGDGPVHNWFRCWNCGFICDVERDALGGPEDRSGTNSEFAAIARKDPNWLNYGVSFAPALHGRSGTVLVKAGPDGNPLPIMLSYSPTVDRFCPFCGSGNWRGDYR